MSSPTRLPSVVRKSRKSEIEKQLSAEWKQKRKCQDAFWLGLFLLCGVVMAGGAYFALTFGDLNRSSKLI